MTDAEIISQGLAKFFKNEPHKIVLWMMTQNLNFGGATACQLIASGRANKVAAFVKSAMEENEPPPGVPA